ncbi:MAG: response regulator [Anaerolineae bacterium]|nr:response regulator [Anaerolineae bacterium]NIN95115.1 response regulator [Anaerolineae bacterium]NIQ78967.1 response regulator [Anaerolineae bacterium]
MVDFCARALRVDGYQITSSMRGHEPAEAARSERFDVILSDIKMPGMDGLDTVQAIKRIRPQVENSLTQRHVGLTLGLPIVTELVELHQGKMWVESQPERGRTFYLTISRHLVPQREND